MKKIAVLMGGTSNERDVSLVSGKNVLEALTGLGIYDVTGVTLNEDSLAALPAGLDACYIALHGGWGENGGVQAALDKCGIPYTGPGAEACRVTMDKIETKKVLDAAGVPTAAWHTITTGEPVTSQVGFPCVVKAPRDGSSVGVYLVKEACDFAKAVAEAQRIDREKFGGAGTALVEAFIPGRETTVGILCGQALPVVEIVAPGGWYGYEEKYNSEETRYPFPEDAFVPEMQRQALAAAEALKCRGIVRVDFRITPEGRMYVLELNTSPGMTGHSLVPKAAAKSGIPFPQLCRMILEAARHD